MNPSTSSETNGFVGLVNDYISLNDNTIIKISNNEYNFLKSIYSENYDVNCIISTLQNGGMDDVKIEYLKQMVRCHHIPMSKLKIFVEKFDLLFKVWTDRRKEQGQGILYIGRRVDDRCCRKK